MRDTERERQRCRQWEKEALCKEPDVGLDPGSPGSRPGPKAGTQLLSHPGIPCLYPLIAGAIYSLNIYLLLCLNQDTLMKACWFSSINFCDSLQTYRT